MGPDDPDSRLDQEREVSQLRGEVNSEGARERNGKWDGAERKRPVRPEDSEQSGKQKSGTMKGQMGSANKKTRHINARSNEGLMGRRQKVSWCGADLSRTTRFFASPSLLRFVVFGFAAGCSQDPAGARMP